MNRRCLNCMKEFGVPKEYEDTQLVCPFCGHEEGTPPKEIYHLYPGTILQGRYIIGTVLGFGGFGITYKAWDEALGTIVAIKEYYPTGLVQRVPGEKKVIIYEGNRRKEYYSGLTRFLDEARNMAKFHDNPNIVHVDNFFEENNTAYIAMEYLDGISLKEYLKQESGKVDSDFAVEIVLSVIDALQQIHKESILHRDISPDNIFLCEGKKIKLIDFGAARFSDEEKEITRSIILKPGFAPPEQYQSKSKQGPWTDIYALAATLYRTITGVLPDESVNRVVEDTVVPPMELDNTIPEYLSTTIMKGMALNAELRFRNVDEFKKALLNETKVLDVKAELKKRKRKRIIGISAAACALLIGGIAAYRIYDKKDPVLNAATVTVWVSYDDAEDKEAKEKMVADMSESFLADQSAVTIQAEAIPRDEYAERLIEAKENKSMPTVYEADYAPAEVMQDAASVKDVYKSLSDIDDYYFLKKYKNDLIDCRKVPLGFNVPVVYVHRGQNVDIGTAEIPGFDVMRERKYFIDPEYYAMYMQSFGGVYEFADSVQMDDMSKMMINAISDDMTGYGLTSVEAALQDFSDEKTELIYYLASTKQLRMINEIAAGYCEMRPITTDKLYGEFTNMFCIDGKASEDETAAAKVWLRYMLEEGPQKTMHIVHKNALPLNKNAYEEFVNTNGKYKIIDSYFSKLSFYPNTQDKMKEISVCIWSEVILDKDKDIDAWMSEQQ